MLGVDRIKTSVTEKTKELCYLGLFFCSCDFCEMKRRDTKSGGAGRTLRGGGSGTQNSYRMRSVSLQRLRWGQGGDGGGGC